MLDIEIDWFSFICFFIHSDSVWIVVSNSVLYCILLLIRYCLPLTWWLSIFFSLSFTWWPLLSLSLTHYLCFWCPVPSLSHSFSLFFSFSISLSFSFSISPVCWFFESRLKITVIFHSKYDQLIIILVCLSEIKIF